MKQPFEKIICERRALDDQITRRLIDLCPGIPVEVVESGRALIADEPGRDGSLVCMHHEGSFVKDFPAGPGAPPCGEKYIVTMLNCPFSCTYCYLRSYLSHRRMVLPTNTEAMLQEVRSVLRSGTPPGMLTTGEFGDSLALDHLTGTTEMLLPLVRRTGTVLEVRTKSASVDHLLDGPEPCDNLVVTWTFGPEEAVRREETGAAALEERLSALERTARRGIGVGVRFDPIIPHYAEMQAYRKIVERLAEPAVRDAIRRIELGVLRFPPGLWEIVRGRNPKSALLRGEFLKDREGKMRLYRPLRARLYRELAGIIRELLGNVSIELSMEDRTVWEDAGIDLNGR